MKKSMTCYIFLLCMAGLIAGCGKIEGEFAVKKIPGESYHRIEGVTEVSVDESVDWAYVVKSIKGNHTLGVALVKKELVWVEVNVRNETLNETQKIIYGKIENLETGNYKILIAENGKKVGEMEFLVYGDSDDTDFDEEP